MAHGQEEFDPKAGKDVLEFGYQQASTYEIKNANKHQLKLEKTAVLSWTNPVRKSKHGTVFVWTDRGRPGAIACFYRGQTNGWRHEFSSLTPEPISAKQRSRVRWSTNEPGLKWTAYSDMKRPARSPNLRLTQMRAIASEFTADLDSNEGRLRLLRQPIYRYESKVHNVVDGAIFTHAQGTNPELLVLVEARDDNKQPWHYALARMTGRGIDVEGPGGSKFTYANVGLGNPSQAYSNEIVGEISGSPK